MKDSSPKYTSAKSSELRSEIRKLIFKCFDELLTADEVHKLQEELKSNPNARKAYMEAVHLHIDLDSYSETVRICNETFLEFPEESHENEADAEPSIISSWLSSRFTTAISYAASVLIVGMCLGCGLGIVAASAIYRQPEFRPIAWNRELPTDAVARIISTHDAKWQEAESPETLPTRSLVSGDQIRLTQGLMSLSYRSGATVILEGPCVYEVRSPVGGKLYSGKLTASASSESDGFAVETAGNLVQMTYGQMGVMNDETTGVLCHAIYGEVRARSLDRGDEPGGYVHMAEGMAARFNDAGVWTLRAPHGLRFATQLPERSRREFTGDVIYLGNLFDDSINSSLSTSVATDGFQAAAETIDLGVAAVRDGGLDVDFDLVDGGAKFNLQNVGGGGPRVRGLPANDTYRSTHAAAISTTGNQILSTLPNGTKLEEGVGMSANEMLTFDLDEIREAGALQNQTLRFVADRAGINDFHEVDNTRISEARMVVIVSNDDGVLSAYLNGKQYDVRENAGVYSFDIASTDKPPRLQRNGEFVKFDIAIPANARFLTLASVMCQNEHDDHTVFSGARLVIGDASLPSTAEPLAVR